MATLPPLPDDYRTFLASHDGEQSYEFDDIDWWLATERELAEGVNIDGNDYAYIHQLQGFSKTLAEFTDGDATTDEEGNAFPLSRLAAGLAIGTGDGDVLFLDPADNYSVWCFHHDGGDVEKLAASFAEWLAEAQLDDSE